MVNKSNKELLDLFKNTPGREEGMKLLAEAKTANNILAVISNLYSKQILEQNGFFVRGLAPTGKAATGLASATRISSDRCETIDSFLLQYRNASPAARKELYTQGKEVWLVDEAEMCGSRKIIEFMKAVLEADVKVVFIGDCSAQGETKTGRIRKSPFMQGCAGGGPILADLSWNFPAGAGKLEYEDSRI
jgi:hypothetical protein